MLSMQTEPSQQPASAFKKCEPAVAPEGLDSYGTPPFTFAGISERTPNKRIRGEHGNRLPVNPLERLRAEGSPRTLAGNRAKQQQLPRRIGCSPVHKAMRQSPTFAVPMPIEMPASVVPVNESQEAMEINDLLSHINMKEPPSGVAAEAGICWIDTTRVCGLTEERTEAWSFGSTPEMPKDHVPWCGNMSNHSPPRAPCIKGQCAPRSSLLAKGVHGFDLPESETAQRALWQGESTGPEADGWSTDEDEDTDLLSGSLGEMGLNFDRTPDMTQPFRTRCRERVNFEPINRSASEPDSPTFGGAMSARTPELSAPLHIGLSATPDLGCPMHMPLSMTPDLSIPRMGYSATPDLTAPLHMGMSATPISFTPATPMGMSASMGMSATPDMAGSLHMDISSGPLDLSAPLRPAPMQQPLRDCSNDSMATSSDGHKFENLNMASLPVLSPFSSDEPLFDFSPGPNRSESPDLGCMDQISI